MAEIEVSEEEVRGKVPRRRQIWIAMLMGVLLVAVILGILLRDELLVWYYAAQIKNREQDSYWMWIYKMVRAGPAGAKRAIEETKMGSSDGDVEQIVAHTLKEYADYDVYPYVSALFSDPDPRARAFAASVAGWLGDPRYREGLSELAQDNTALPDGWFGNTVGSRAKTALHWLTLPAHPILPEHDTEGTESPWRSSAH